MPATAWPASSRDGAGLDRRVVVTDRRGASSNLMAAHSCTAAASDFSFNVARIEPGINPNTDLRRAFNAWADKTQADDAGGHQVGIISISNGAWLSSYGVGIAPVSLKRRD